MLTAPINLVGSGLPTRVFRVGESTIAPDYTGTMVDRLYRVKRTLAEMLQTRGYAIDPDEESLFRDLQTDGDLDRNATDQYRLLLKRFAEHYAARATKLGVSFHQALNKRYTETKDSVRYLNAIDEAEALQEEHLANPSPVNTSELATPDSTNLLELKVYFVEPVYEGGKFKDGSKGNADIIYADMDDLDLTHGIAVAVKKFNHSVYKAEAFHPTMKLEKFDYDELNKNVVQHFLQPGFDHLTNRERNQEIRDHGIQMTQMPRMSHVDPVARFYGARVGDVFRIRRQTRVGLQISFRAVMPTPLSVDAGNVKDVDQIYNPQ